MMSQSLHFPYDYDYLLEGNVDQRHAHAALKQLSVFSLLSDYSPILVGTVPLDIHIHASDLSWSIEIFAQPIPTSRQNGFKHMMIEHRILKLRGESDKEQLRKLKSAGWKTEPAFALAYKLEGDPYETLLEMYDWSNEQLEAFLKNALCQNG